MTMETKDQRLWLSYVRHELGTPINSIIGYSGLILDELEDLGELEDSNLKIHIQKINAQGEQILSLIKTILAAERLDTDPVAANFDDWFKHLYTETLNPIKIIIDSCEKVLAVIPRDFHADVGKIDKSVNNLSQMINDLFEQQDLGFNLVNKTSEQSPLITQRQPTTISQEALVKIKNVEKTNQTNIQGKILIVDDQENNRDLLARYLIEEGHNVAAAANGLEAMQMIQTGEYDLILLDIIMPEMDGYQVLQWIRSSQWYYIPVIMISALDELDSVVKCIEMGAEDYLPKPFNPILLRARIGASLEKKRLRDQETLYIQQLAQANTEISSLNERLKAENLQMSAKLEITRQLQQMILPREKELDQIEELEIAGIMQPAEEVGGDYYDILTHQGRIKISIGDVTGHGLESSVLMLMAQTAVRTLIEADETDPKRFLEILNRTLYKNVKRMKSRRQLTFSLMDYQDGKLNVTGQHEEIIVVRAGGVVERIDTVDLGLPIALTSTIAEFVTQIQIKLNHGDVVVLYTDGITEAENNLEEYYGIERLCEIVSQNWQLSAQEIRQLVIDDVFGYIGDHKVYDDITLVVFKKR